MLYTEGRIWVIPTWVDLRDHFQQIMRARHFYRYMYICETMAYSHYYEIEDGTRIWICYKNPKTNKLERARVDPHSCLWNDRIRIGDPVHIGSITFDDIAISPYAW